jgi:hypothetical protein
MGGELARGSTVHDSGLHFSLIKDIIKFFMLNAVILTNRT